MWSCQHETLSLVIHCDCWDLSWKLFAGFKVRSRLNTAETVKDSRVGLYSALTLHWNKPVCEYVCMHQLVLKPSGIPTQDYWSGSLFILCSSVLSRWKHTHTLTDIHRQNTSRLWFGLHACCLELLVKYFVKQIIKKLNNGNWLHTQCLRVKIIKDQTSAWTRCFISLMQMAMIMIDPWSFSGLSTFSLVSLFLYSMSEYTAQRALKAFKTFYCPVGKKKKTVLQSLWPWHTHVEKITVTCRVHRCRQEGLFLQPARFFNLF